MTPIYNYSEAQEIINKDHRATVLFQCPISDAIRRLFWVDNGPTDRGLGSNKVGYFAG